MSLSLGEYLRQTRESRNLTLEQVAQATRVKLSYLRAFESDEPALLPSKVQARGYLRLIATALDIDPQPLLDAWPDKAIILPVIESMPQAKEDESSTGSTEQSTDSPITDESIPQPTIEPQILDMVDSPQVESPPPPAGSSSFVFSQIGQQLRNQRETLGISIEDAERFTRLKIRYLQAIEEGRLGDLPSLVQGRGMLRNYAHFLNMDSDAILDEFAEGLQLRRVERSEAENPLVDKSSSPKSRKRAHPNTGLRRFLTPDLMIGGVLFLILAVFVIWGTARVSGLQNQAASPTVPSISELLINETVQPALIEMTPTSPNPLSTGDIDAPRQPVTTEGGETAPTEFISANNDPVQVYIVANQRTWMRVTVDNRVAFDGRTVPGSAYPFTGKESIELVCGNGAGIEVIHNQNNLGLLGAAGEVVRLIFTAEGTLLPTPLFTLTPSPTSQPTETPRPSPTQPTSTVTPLLP